MRARARRARVELDRDARLGVEAKDAALVEAQHERGAAVRRRPPRGAGAPGVPHPRAHARGPRDCAPPGARPSSARSRARRARRRIATRAKSAAWITSLLSGKRSGQARATIIQSRAVSRVDDPPAVKSPAESLNFRQSLLEFLEAGPGREEALLAEFERKKERGRPALLLAPLPPHPPRLHRAAGGAALEARGRAPGADAARAGPRPGAPGGDSRLLRERQPRAAQPEDHRDRDVREDRALRGERRPHRPLQPRLLPAGAAPGGAPLEAARPEGGADPARPRRLQAGERRARATSRATAC